MDIVTVLRDGFLTGLVGVLLLETINYLEHYGLQRNRLEDGRYERVQPNHSWNANYHFGRIVLYELTRHSDHHYIASKKYQILDNHDNAPILPFGYPAMILIALIPPLWFQIMDVFGRELPKLPLREPGNVCRVHPFQPNSRQVPWHPPHYPDLYRHCHSVRAPVSPDDHLLGAIVSADY